MDDREIRRSGYDLTLPEALLRSEAMRRACAVRDFGEIFRLINRRTGTSHAAMAAAIGKMTSSRVSDIIRGVRGIRGHEVIERVADGFGIPGAMLGMPARPWEGSLTDGGQHSPPAYSGKSARENQETAHVDPIVVPGPGAGHEEVETTKRRVAVKLAGLTLTAPAAAFTVLDQAAAEAAEFTRQAEASALTPEALDHLDRAVTQLSQSFQATPPRQHFDAVREYRHLVGVLLQGRHTHQQGRELLTFAGFLSEMLAWLAHDLGHNSAGLTFADDAFAHGRQAGNSQLCAWAMDAAASINLYAQRPVQALTAARRGLAQGPVNHPLTVRLHAQAGRASAADGNAEEFTAAFRAAEDAYERIPPRPPLRLGDSTMPLAEYALTSYPASSHIWLGQPEPARQYAERAIAAYEAAPGSSPSREAIARIDLALAHAQLGDVDGAVFLGHQALDSIRVADSVHKRADELTTYLTHRAPKAATVESLRERLATTSTA
ncbi:XRE family transcriptional regulator [Streptomyces sp. NPDC057638]|uniref:XRE family transcriptional regulator n=1 Tax=Streptomyces sp. NPDC057638 TaxID=3346190 RepID=UPI0036877EDC